MPSHKVSLERVRISVGERSANDLLHTPVVQVDAWSESAAPTPGLHDGNDVQTPRELSSRVKRTQLCGARHLVLLASSCSRHTFVSGSCLHNASVVACVNMWSCTKTAWRTFGKQYPNARRTVSSLVWLPTAVVFTQYFYSVKLVSGRSMQVRSTQSYIESSPIICQVAHLKPTMECVAGPSLVQSCFHI